MAGGPEEENAAPEAACSPSPRRRLPRPRRPLTRNAFALRVRGRGAQLAAMSLAINSFCSKAPGRS
eukprot:11225277-Lingulodinium_polyedra.AAC.1